MQIDDHDAPRPDHIDISWGLVDRMYHIGTYGGGNPVIQLFRVMVVAAALVVDLVNPRPAQAERCWMVGCVGLIGYVYIPVKSPYEACKTVAKIEPFGDDVLPDVNAVVANQFGATNIYSGGEIDREIDNFPRVVANTVDGSCDVEVRAAANLSLLGSVMGFGARVKILGYRTFHGASRWDDLLFALVRVESD